MLDGFVRLDDGPCPAQVSPHVWAGVFPPDRPRVLTLAGRLFLAGWDPDKAVERAVEEVIREGWRTGALARSLKALGPAFESGTVSLPPPSHVAAACLGVWATARASGPNILSDHSPVRAAFYHRRWRAPHGMCLMCGRPAPEERLYQVSWSSDGGDAIHKGCLKAMAMAGPVFGDLVVQEARSMGEREPVMVVLSDDDDAGWETELNTDAAIGAEHGLYTP